MTAVNPTLSRRALLGSGAALVVSFSLLRSPVSTVLAQAPPRLPGSLRRSPKLDAWLRVDANGITVFTGKAELGQGIKTALLQVAAEELGVEPSQIEFITADGFHITEACRRYVAPLMQGEAYPRFRNGLPDYVKLRNVAVPKKLSREFKL